MFCDNCQAYLIDESWCDDCQIALGDIYYYDDEDIFFELDEEGDEDDDY